MEHRINRLIHQINRAYLAKPTSLKVIVGLTGELYRTIQSYGIWRHDSGPASSAAPMLPRMAASTPEAANGCGISAFDAQLVGQECLKLWQPVADKQGIAFSITNSLADPRAPIALWSAVRHSLFCLIGNAIRLTHRGKIALRLRGMDGGSKFRFEVVNNGSGISVGQRQQLIRYFQSPTDFRGSTPSIGAELIVATHLIKSVDGTIGHRENADGSSTFWIEVPIRSKAKPAKCVLIADDDQLQREFARAVLVSRSYEVMCAATGFEALRAVEAKDFDVVLMDLNMPIMDGLLATRHIRSLRGERQFVPILGLTVQHTREYIQRCQRAGMNSHLAKPINPATLKVLVDLAVQSRSPGQHAGWFGNQASHPRVRSLFD